MITFNFSSDFCRYKSEVSSERNIEKCAPNPITVGAMEHQFENLLQLPDEILLKIMGFLSNKDVLKNLAQVSKRFHRLSKDPHLIKRIVLNFAPVYKLQPGVLHGWKKDRRKKYYQDFSKVLKESQNLQFLSLDFDDSYYPNEGNNVITDILPSLNPQCLEEFHIKFRLFWNFDTRTMEFRENPIYNYLPGFESVEVLLKYLEKCSNMKTLKLHIWNHDDFGDANAMILKTILGSELENVEKIHLTYKKRRLPHDAILTIKNALKNITKNTPEIKSLRLDLLSHGSMTIPGSSRTGINELCQLFQEIATEKNITIVSCVPIPGWVYVDKLLTFWPQ